jgi:hypothetical protein
MDQPRYDFLRGMAYLVVSVGLAESIHPADDLPKRPVSEQIFIYLEADTGQEPAEPIEVALSFPALAVPVARPGGAIIVSAAHDHPPVGSVGPVR